MKVKIIIDFDTETGNYSLEYSSEKKESLEYFTLVEILDTIVQNWKLKFVD